MSLILEHEILTDNQDIVWTDPLSLEFGNVTRCMIPVDLVQIRAVIMVMWQVIMLTDKKVIFIFKKGLNKTEYIVWSEPISIVFGRCTILVIWHT